MANPKTSSISAVARKRRLQALRMRLPTGEELCTTRQIPDGYTLVKRGDVYVTRNCRTQTHAAEQPIYQVHSASTCVPLGIACPSAIAESVTRRRDETASSRAAAVAARDRRDQAEAESAIRRLYPRMPKPDVNAVLAHAFLKGSGRVGRAKTSLDQDERILRAVTAHARHKHTRYDDIINGKAERKGRTAGQVKEEARQEVRMRLSGVVAAWKGEEKMVAGKKKVEGAKLGSKDGSKMTSRRGIRTGRGTSGRNNAAKRATPRTRKGAKKAPSK